MMEKKTCCVRWSTPESRAAGRISVLAIAEAVFAVALYWWIAFYFDTHLHLVTSLFVAPLLLLRSERSIEAGVDWFQRDWVDAENYDEWSRTRKGIWLGIMAVLSFTVSWWVCDYLAHAWLEDQTGLALFLYAALIGMIGAFVGLIVVVAVAVADADADAVAVTGAITGVATGAAAGAVMGVATGAAAGAVMGLGVIWSMVMVGHEVMVGYGVMVVVGVGYAIRAIIIRLSATLRFLFFDGIRSLPGNWRKNNFVIDTMTPAELVPGIGKYNEVFTLRWVISELEGENIVGKIVFSPVILIWFIPVLFYRLNIKATCWFYWPLAFLLRPLPTDDRSERRRRNLCWPWTDPAQRFLIKLSILGSIVSTAYLIGTKASLSFPDLPAVPFWLEYMLTLDWSRLEPWYWTNLMIAVTSAAMLWIAGKAVADYEAGLDYSEENPWSLPTMHILWNLRMLAVGAAILLALGSVVVHRTPEWLEYLPERQAEWLIGFYG